MKRALIRFRESAFPFWNADFHLFYLKTELIAFWISYPDLPHPASMSDLMAYIMTTLQLRDFITKDTTYTEFLYDLSNITGCLKVCFTGYIKRWMKLRLALQFPPLLDFGYRTVIFTFNYCFNNSTFIYQFMSKKALLSKQPLFPLVISGNNSSLFQEGCISLILKRLNIKIHLAWFPCIQSRTSSSDWWLSSFPNCLHMSLSWCTVLLLVN